MNLANFINNERVPSENSIWSEPGAFGALLPRSSSLVVKPGTVRQRHELNKTDMLIQQQQQQHQQLIQNHQQQQHDYATALSIFGEAVVQQQQQPLALQQSQTSLNPILLQQQTSHMAPQQSTLQHFFQPVTTQTPAPLLPGSSLFNGTPYYGSFTAHMPQPPLQFYAPIMYHNLNNLNGAFAGVQPGGMVGQPSELLPPSTAPARKDWFDYLLQMAHQKYNAQDYSGALSILQELHNLQPEHLPTLLLLGCTCYSLGLHQLSVYYNNMILALDSQFAEAYSNLGTTYRAMAMEAAAAGTTTSPTSSQPGYNLEMAERYYRMAVAIRPKYWDANINLAGLLSSQGRWRDGLEVYSSIERAMEEEFPPEERIETLLSTLVVTENESVLVAAIAECEKRKKKRIAYQKAAGTVPSGEASGYSSERRRDLYYAKGNLSFVTGDVLGAKREYYKALAAVGIDMLKVILRTPPGSIPQPPLSPQQVLMMVQQPKPPGETTFSPTTASVLQTLAKIYQDTGNTSMAISLYYVSLGVHATANVCNNLGILLSSHRLNESIGWYEVGLALDNNHAHLYTNLGSALKDRGQASTLQEYNLGLLLFAQGIECYQRAIALHPDFYIALANLANVYKDQGRVDEAIELYRRALRVKPDFIEAFCNYVNSLFFVCKWDGRDAKLLKIREIVERQLQEGVKTIPKGVPTVLPFHTFTYSSLEAWMVRDISRRTADRVVWNVLTSDWFAGFPARPGNFLTLSPKMLASMSAAIHRSAHYPYPYTLPPLPTAASPIIRIGYVSSDFNNHPLAHLMQSVFGLHDRDRFRVYCYSLSPSDNSPYRSKIEAGADVFIDVSNWSLRDIVERIALVDKIHILCNLNGYTKGGRNEIFAARPAPLQMAFMGFAGTMGGGKVYDPTVDADAAAAADSSTSAFSARNIGRANTEHSLRRSASESSLARSRPSTLTFDDTEFFDTLSDRFIDYLVADEIACPRNLVCGEPITEAEPDVVAPSSPAYSSRQVRGPVVPQDDRNRMYTEGLIYMPHSYFVNDHRQGFKEEDDAEVDAMLLHAMHAPIEDMGMMAISGSDDDDLPEPELLKWRREQIKRLKMRQDLFPGLPEDTVIYANFNQLYKACVFGFELTYDKSMDPDIFKVWLNILKRVPNSVLWLLKFPAAGEAHIMKFAKEHAGEEVAQRILFTDVALKHVHIHRGRIADVFLDTPECNAHTTAADILWSGTPIISYPKYDFKMCSRVAASVAYATGSWDPQRGNPFADKGERGLANGPQRLMDPMLLGHQMVVNSYEEYEERAVEFGRSLWWDWQQIRPNPLPHENDASAGLFSGSNNVQYQQQSRQSEVKANALPVPTRSDSKINLALLPEQARAKQEASSTAAATGMSGTIASASAGEQTPPQQRNIRFINVNPFYPSRAHPTHILVARGTAMQLRRRLFLTRTTMPLFEADRWVRNLETGMRLAWKRWEAGMQVIAERNQQEYQSVGMYASTGATTASPPDNCISRRRTTSRCLWIADTDVAVRREF
ncbi:hypothetical protein SmJEL517_g01934 [Synchytrium microbalum]|uniref:protein O-GlcNAc transferase n=1 Tax=Synchytrium microbalum TaxID=1806994 RepID=A0A507CDX8_9FUNG|nr:uncharacterized protein SmJEL517_g01934 [Synchytrium microbalum]TPX35753.1 hypothetical protein SmJEL517_g01934 [Synchytrium microbalum]